MRRRRGGSRLLSVFVALLAAAAGYALALHGRAGLEEEIRRLERANRQLAANAGVLSEALRAARAPLQRHIFALEGRLGALERLAARSAAPAEEIDPLGPAPGGDVANSESAKASDRVDREPAAAAADLPPAGGSRTSPLARAGEDSTPAAAASTKGDPTPPPAVFADEDPTPPPAVFADEDPTPPPAVSTAPGPVNAGPRAATGDLTCRSLANADFELTAIGDETTRLAGRLALSLWREAGELALHVAGDAASPYSLRELPLHVSFDCGEVPYIVSVCSRADEPVAVRGSVLHAESWSPCAEEGVQSRP